MSLTKFIRWLMPIIVSGNAVDGYRACYWNARHTACWSMNRDNAIEGCKQGYTD